MRQVAAMLALSALMWCSAATGRAVRHSPRGIVMQATAFSGARHVTASGTIPHDGIVAADPSVLPLGTRIRVRGTDGYDGYYLVTDTGSKILGRHIDLYLPSVSEAKRFGTKTVRVQVLRMGTGKEQARQKDAASQPSPHE